MYAGLVAGATGFGITFVDLSTNPHFFVQKDAANVGIFTSTPEANLEIASTGVVGVPGLYLSKNNFTDN